MTSFGMAYRTRALFALILKESYQIWRDPSSILIAFVLPMILLFLFGYGISLDSNKVPLGLVVQDDAPEIQSLIDSFRFTRYFDLKINTRRKDIETGVVSDDLRGMVVIPVDFSKALFQSIESAKIQVIADGSEPNTANFVQNYAQGVVNNWLRQKSLSGVNVQEPPVQAEFRFWYNAKLTSRNFLVPGSIAIIMTLIGTLLTALVVAREWELGTMEALMTTPISIRQLIAGKLIPYFILGMGSMVLCLLFAIFIFQVPFRGSLWVLGSVTAVYLSSALSTGLLISTLARNQFVASQIAIFFAFLPSFLLSGFIFEINSMPPVIQAVTYIVPARYFVPCLQTLFLTGDIFPLILPNVGFMAVYTTVLLTFIVMKTRKRLE